MTWEAQKMHLKFSAETPFAQGGGGGGGGGGGSKNEKCSE